MGNLCTIGTREIETERSKEKKRENDRLTNRKSGFDSCVPVYEIIYNGKEDRKQ